MAGQREAGEDRHQQADAVPAEAVGRTGLPSHDPTLPPRNAQDM
jgi:hypothetical protein